jgi:hypothetical protein
MKYEDAGEGIEMTEECKRTRIRNSPYNISEDLYKIRAYRILLNVRNDAHTRNVQYGLSRKKQTLREREKEREKKLEILRFTADKLNSAMDHINECDDKDYDVSKAVFTSIDMLRNKYNMFNDIDKTDLSIPMETINEYHKSIIPLVDDCIDKIIIDTKDRKKAKYPFLKFSN